jgi:ABC-type multidrug transport system permease subunit
MIYCKYLILNSIQFKTNIVINVIIRALIEALVIILLLILCIYQVLFMKYKFRKKLVFYSIMYQYQLIKKMTSL